MSSSGQKFISRNRAPRVQIDYEVELYGAQKKVELPFVMGVISDLHGNPAEPPPKVEDRKFVEINTDNFDDRMKAMKPRVVVNAENTLKKDGSKLPVALTFETLDDFSPGAVARAVEPLRELLNARNQLQNLLTYMDGKNAAEDLIAGALKNPGEFKKLVETLSLQSKGAVPAEDGSK
jgi:type VI secretion system protein ImpB